MRMLALATLILTAPAIGQDEEQGTIDVPKLDANAAKIVAEAMGPKRHSLLCEGDGCDAYLPILQKRTTRFDDIKARRKWGATLGGLSGALIGEEVAGAPGAIALGALGAFAGYDYIDRERWEEDAKAYDAAWQRGDDIYYNPANRLPLEAHWMHAGPAVPLAKDKKK